MSVTLIAALWLCQYGFFSLNFYCSCLARTHDNILTVAVTSILWELYSYVTVLGRGHGEAISFPAHCFRLGWAAYVNRNRHAWHITYKLLFVGVFTCFNLMLVLYATSLSPWLRCILYHLHDIISLITPSKTYPICLCDSE